MKLPLKLKTEHIHNDLSTRHVGNYLLYGNSSLPETRLSFGNLHSLREIGVRRGLGKTHSRNHDTHDGNKLRLPVWPTSSCLAVPVAQRPAWCSTRSTTSLW